MTRARPFLLYLLLTFSLSGSLVESQKLIKAAKNALSPLQMKIQQQIDSQRNALGKLLGVDPEQKFLDIFPDIKKYNVTQIKGCYDMAFGDDEYNLFENTIYVGIQSYYKQFSDNFEFITFPVKVKSLFDSFNGIARHTVACLLQPASFKLGLTQLSDWSDKDYKGLLGARPDDLENIGTLYIRRLSDIDNNKDDKRKRPNGGNNLLDQVNQFPMNRKGRTENDTAANFDNTPNAQLSGDSDRQTDNTNQSTFQNRSDDLNRQIGNDQAQRREGDFSRPVSREEQDRQSTTRRPNNVNNITPQRADNINNQNQRTGSSDHFSTDGSSLRNRPDTLNRDVGSNEARREGDGQMSRREQNRQSTTKRPFNQNGDSSTLNTNNRNEAITSNTARNQQNLSGASGTQDSPYALNVQPRNRDSQENQSNDNRKNNRSDSEDDRRSANRSNSGSNSDRNENRSNISTQTNRERQNGSQARQKRQTIEVASECKVKNRSRLPAKFDWRTKGKVTPAKYQGSCGSCWAFSALASLESAYLIKDKTNNKKFDLSEQELLSCARKNGCKGGTAVDAYNYMLKNKGVGEESALPYDFKEKKCNANKSKPKKVAKINDYCLRGVYVKNNGKAENLTDQEIQFIIREFGPVYATINADDLSMKNLKSGVYSNPKCPKQTNHAITIVGWDEEAWIVKNSWGQSWGDNGFFRMKRGQNLCGLNTYIMFPIV